MCGQTCVAMIAKVSLKRAIEACGKSEITGAKDLLKALRELGVEVKGSRLIQVTGSRMPQRCLQLVAFAHYSPRKLNGTLRHWRIRWDGFIYDPAYGVDLGGSGKPSEAYWSRVCSYIEL